LWHVGQQTLPDQALKPAFPKLIAQVEIERGSPQSTDHEATNIPLIYGLGLGSSSQSTSREEHLSAICGRRSNKSHSYYGHLVELKDAAFFPRTVL
jgi:hypothetical protein